MQRGRKTRQCTTLSRHTSAGFAKTPSCEFDRTPAVHSERDCASEEAIGKSEVEWIIHQPHRAVRRVIAGHDASRAASSQKTHPAHRSVVTMHTSAGPARQWRAPAPPSSQSHAQVRCCSLTCSLPFAFAMTHDTSSGIDTTFNSAQWPLAAPCSSSTT